MMTVIQIIAGLLGTIRRKETEDLSKNRDCPNQKTAEIGWNTWTSPEMLKKLI